MLKIENPSKDLLELHPSGPLDEADIEQLKINFEKLLSKNEEIKLLIFASEFSGWATASAAEKHFQLVKNHHKKVSKIAFIIGHPWQKWIAMAIKPFVHPKVKNFEGSDTEAAKTWISQ